MSKAEYQQGFEDGRQEGYEEARKEATLRAAGDRVVQRITTLAGYWEGGQDWLPTELSGAGLKSIAADLRALLARVPAERGTASVKALAISEKLLAFAKELGSDHPRYITLLNACVVLDGQEVRATPPAPDTPQPEPSGVLMEYMDDLLHDYGSYLAARYGAPVYLVGSALTKATATDLDIRVVLPDAEWEARFGASVTAFDRDRPARYVAEIGKQSAYLVSKHSANVDLQVQPESVAKRHSEKPRRLISMAIPLAAETGRDWSEVEQILARANGVGNDSTGLCEVFCASYGDAKRLSDILLTLVREDAPAPSAPQEDK